MFEVDTVLYRMYNRYTIYWVYNYWFGYLRAEYSLKCYINKNLFTIVTTNIRKFVTKQYQKKLYILI